MRRTRTGGFTRPRILLLSPAMSPPPGGIATLTDSLLRGLHGIGDVSLVAVSRTPVGLPGRRVIPAISGRPGRLVSRAWFAGVAVGTVVRTKPDVVHAVTWRAAMPIILLPKRIRPTTVVHACGTELVRGGPLLAPTRNLVFRRADGVAAISQYTAGVVHRLTGRTAAVLPPSADPPTDPQLERSNRSPGEVVVVLSVAALVARKGHQELVRAAHVARTRGAQCVLTIAGADGPEHKHIDELRERLNAHDWLTIEASVPADRLRELYDRADVFALLTRNVPRAFEGFGIVLAEAGLAGLPIIAGRSGGSQEVVAAGRGGYVVSTEEEAADAIVSLCANQELRLRMGREARRFAEQFLPASVDKQLALFYSSLMQPAMGDRTPSGSPASHLDSHSETR
jgi:glycosyltransferase involved in cell wall biosynthesis